MGRTEREKGMRGELEVAAIFRAVGFDCDRTPNSGGLRIRGDLAGSVPTHIEVKRAETARPWAWFEQARADAPAGVVPVVAFRRSRSSWLALMPLEHLAALLAVVELGQRPVPREYELGVCRRALEQIAGCEPGLDADHGHELESALDRCQAIAREALEVLPAPDLSELEP